MQNVIDSADQQAQGTGKCSSSDSILCTTISEQSSWDTGPFTHFCSGAPRTLLQHTASYFKLLSCQCPNQRKQRRVGQVDEIYQTGPHPASFDCNANSVSSFINSFNFLLKYSYFCKNLPDSTCTQVPCSTHTGAEDATYLLQLCLIRSVWYT